MKNYLKTTFVLALVALFAFSACSKDEKTAPNGELRKVSLKLTQEQADQLGTRAVGPHVDATKVVVFNAGYIYFTNPSGGITKTITIEAGAGAYANDKVGIETLTKTGIVVENVDAGSTKVHIAGNITAPTTPPANISEVLATVVTLESQYDKTDKGVDKVALYGVGEIKPIEGALGEKTYDFTATVEINPMNSRLEIGQFTADGEIKSYIVEGIFINNYYEQLKFDGTVIASTDLKDNKKEADKYVGGAGSYTGTAGVIFDYDTDGVGEQKQDATGLITYPDKTVTDGSKVWGYNFLVANQVVNPEIAIRIKDVVLKNGDAESYKGTQFISISSFYEDNTNATPLVMAKGNVYRIKDIVFNEGDLRPKPFEESKKVLVKATLMKWESTDIGYKLD